MFVRVNATSEFPRIGQWKAVIDNVMIAINVCDYYSDTKGRWWLSGE